MSQPNHFLLEGLDGLGKDTLLGGIQSRYGYHQVLHYTKPILLEFYSEKTPPSIALRKYQEASFRTMFQLLTGAPSAKIICNRAHLGECVYAPLYRKYSGEYVFEFEREFNAQQLSHARLVLLTEDFGVSTHFVDDGKSLGGKEKRQEEQQLFLDAFHTSIFPDKRAICVTDRETGKFRNPESILMEVLS